MKSVCLVHEVPSQQLPESFQQFAVDIFGGVQTGIFDLLYSLRRIPALSNLEHASLSLQDLSQFVKDLSVRNHLVRHGHWFCSELKNKTRYEMVLSMLEDVVKNTHVVEGEEARMQKPNRFWSRRERSTLLASSVDLPQWPASENVQHMCGTKCAILFRQKGLPAGEVLDGVDCMEDWDVSNACPGFTNLIGNGAWICFLKMRVRGSWQRIFDGGFCTLSRRPSHWRRALCGGSLKLVIWFWTRLWEFFHSKSWPIAVQP